MSGGAGSERKQAYFAKLIQLLDDYPQIIIVSADNVGSHHMQRIRIALRGQAVLLMGKNTMVRKAIRGHLEANSNLERLLPHIKGNVGFIFIKGQLSDVAKIVSENKVEALARAGSIAPVDVFVPAGPTGLEPTKTSFFQALNITTRIAKGQIDISNEVHLIHKGEKVGNSESALLSMLNIKPFKYGLAMVTIYDNGSIYDPSVLSITKEDILNSFQNGVRNIACISLATKYPTRPAVPHYLTNGFKKILSIALSTEYTFDQAQKVKEILANPSALVQAAPVQEVKKGAEPAKEKEPEPEEQSDEDMGFGLFD
jgi:large subunit ribosomal protein LP0